MSRDFVRLESEELGLSEGRYTQVALLVQFKGSVSTKIQQKGDSKMKLHPPNFYIVVTHLKAFKGFDSVRTAQAYQLLCELENQNVAKRENKKENNNNNNQSRGTSIWNFPVVICGDFNATPKSDVYKLYANAGTLHKMTIGDPPKEHSIFHQMKLTSAYNRYSGQENTEPEFTIFNEFEKDCHDYIWYSPEYLNPLNVLELPTKEQLTQGCCLPNQSVPSDHLPMMCEFEML